ncbi:MAG: DUF5688 family protein [Lachnospiraceae bacterium]|nr:DUF5688 family protein [Lachnospiraceae bacterium]
MEFKEFLKKISEGIENNYLNMVKVKINEVLKNNGVVLTGVTITREDQNISPNIYVNDYYENFTNNRQTISEIIHCIIETYESNRIVGNVDMSFFMDYETVSGMLYCKLINYRENKKLLKDVPYRKFMDLAIVPYCMLGADNGIDNTSGASILIHNSHVKSWGKDKERVIEDALNNTRNCLGTQISDMNDVMKGLLERDDDLFELSLHDMPETDTMFVMSNNIKLNGAISMTDTDALEEFSEKLGSDLFVIPSSIHEVILIPASSPEDISKMDEMVVNVNETELLKEEILSDHVYYFTRKDGYLKIQDNGKPCIMAGYA